MIKSTITGTDKKRITADWNREIPSLGVYKPMHLMNRVGPLIVGLLLEVKSDKDKYIPTFHVHNLLRPFEVITLSLNYELKPINKSRHEINYKESVLKMVEQGLLPFEGDLGLATIINAYKAYLENGYMGNILPYVFEDIVLLSGWCRDERNLNKGLEFAESKMKSWSDHVLTRLGGLDQWLSSLEKKARNYDYLQNGYEEQIIKLKVDKLPIRELKC
jgi:hypothetical protein